MKKSLMMVLALGLALCIPGCGFDGGIDATVTVIEATPTPEPTPTPEVTPTPEPTPTPAPVIEQSPSGINVEKKDGTYYTTADVNLRADCSAEAELVDSVTSGSALKSTGVCENGWIRIDHNGQVCFVSGDYVSTTAPAGGAAEGGAAEQTGEVIYE